MTAEQRFERSLPALLEELGESSPPDYRDSLLGRTATMRQRPAWTFPERWIPMDTTLRRMPVAPINWRLLALAALLILAAVAVTILVAGRLQKLPLPPYGPAANGMMVYEARGDIFVADPRTGESRAIITGPEVDSDPRFSPDGQHIAFVRTSGSGGYGVITDADGANPRRIPGRACTLCNGWSWAGDSRTLLVTSTELRNDIALVDTVNGGGPVISVVGTVYQASFRPPDDQQIAYIVGDGIGEFGDSLYVMNRDGSDRRQIASRGEIQNFEYSPDGSKIAYNEYIAADDRHVIRVVGADGRADRMLPFPAGLVHQGGPRWAPDGESLLVWRTYLDRGPLLSILGTDGSFIRDLPGIVIAGGWLMSPDGSSVAYWPGADSRGLGRCPLGDEETCPAIIVDVADGKPTKLPFLPIELSWQRTSR